MNNRSSKFKELFKKAKVQEDVQKETSGTGGNRDETWWNPPWNENEKNGFAKIAFLPFKDFFETEGESTSSPYLFLPTHTNMHGTKGKKYWNILCPGQKPFGESISCPICETFFDFYNESESSKKIAQKMGLSRKRYYVGNIIVIKNKMNPDEEGKIFKWKFGVQIRDKINGKINPPDGDEPNNIHNPYDVTPFKIILSEQGQGENSYRSYINSEWDVPGKSIVDWIAPKLSDEDKMKWIEENIIDKVYAIDDFVSEESYKSESELRKIVNDIMNHYNVVSPTNTTTTSSSTGSELNVEAAKKTKKTEKAEKSVEEKVIEEEPSIFSIDDEDEAKEKSEDPDDDDFDIDKLFS